MGILGNLDLSETGPALKDANVDGWLLYDFRGNNPVARRITGVEGMGTRRLFIFLPAVGSPVAVAHKIELQALEGFPGEVRPYASWSELHGYLGEIVSGKRVAMEVSALDAVPYLDWVPSGVVGLIEKLGGEVVSSDRLVSLFASRWSPSELAGHVQSSEIIAEIARSTIAEVIKQAGTAREATVQRGILEAFDAAGLATDHPPIVAFGPNAANPHYEPREGSDALLRPDEVVLVDLWAGTAEVSVYADQTWMGFAGGSPPDEVITVWNTVRDARDAVVDRLRRAARDGETVVGAELDDAARGVIKGAGYGDAFFHRTGHSIDLQLHGSGPHLDNFETTDTREIIPGVGFSIEPGVYLTGRFGVRSEINAVWFEDGPELTPAEIQRDLILPR